MLTRAIRRILSIDLPKDHPHKSIGQLNSGLDTMLQLPVKCESTACKLCGSKATVQFGLPYSKKTGHPIPDEPDDCWYYQCDNCSFLFTDAIDNQDHTEIYDETYWENQDPDWYGRVTETFRLVALSNELLNIRLDRAEIVPGHLHLQLGDIRHHCVRVFDGETQAVVGEPESG